MSQMANLIAFDGASTPVSHTLVPISQEVVGNEKIAVYREGLSSLPVYAQVSATVRIKKMQSGVYRTSVRVEVPVMEAVGTVNAAGYTSPPKVAYVNTVDAAGYFHERSTIEQRRLARQLAVNILNGIATTVTPVTTGPAAELMDQLVSPT